MKKIITGLFVFALVFSFNSMNTEKASAQTSNETVSYQLGNQTLRNGSRGEAARELQRFLNDTLNMGLVLDGIIGPKTIAVMKEWQRERGLVADGLIGPKTKVKILESAPNTSVDGIIVQPNTQKFTGKLTALDSTVASTRMWGTHAITIKESINCLDFQECASTSVSKIYPVSANNSAEVLRDLKLYENSEVVILGKLSYHNIEGGFWGIVANNVKPLLSTPDAPVINKISGPQSLNVNETGTWKVSAHNSGGGNLSYSVDWGEVAGNDCLSSITPCMALKEPQLFQQSATFTHTYSNAGVYSPTFTVTNDNGKTAKTSLSVKVSDLVVSPSLSYSVATDKLVYKQNEKIQITINARNNSATTKTLNWATGCQVGYVIGGYDSSSNLICTQSTTSVNIPPYTTNVWTIEHNPQNLDYKLPVGTYVLTGKVLGYGQANTNISIVADNLTSVTVLSPNGGETYKIGDNKLIKWTDKIITTQILPMPYDIRLLPVMTIPPCITNTPCPVYDELPPYKIAQKIIGHSYEWRVGDYLSSGSVSNIPDGKYRMEICRHETSVCDISDSYFKITSSHDDETIVYREGNVQDLECGELSLTLKRGMEDSQVKCLQKMLNQKGFKIKGIAEGNETNFFGTRTLEALKAFQAQNGLVADGVFGPTSRSVLSSIGQ